MLKAFQEGECEIGLEMALMKLVEDDCVDSLEARVGQQAAGKDAFGHEAKTGARRGDIFKPDLVADGLANGFAELLGRAAGGETGGNAAGFKDQDLSRKEGKEGGGDAGGLAGAGRGLEDDIGGMAERGEDLGKKGVDREGDHGERLGRREHRFRSGL